MPYPRYWNNERLSELQRFREEGLTNQEIADKMGTTKSNIGSVAYRYRLPPTKSRPQVTVTTKDLAMFTELERQGLTFQQMADKLGVSFFRIQYLASIVRRRKAA